MDDNTRPANDDAQQPQDDGFFDPLHDEQKLPGDYDPPAAPASDVRPDLKLPPDHPEFDYDNDTGEAYDEGATGATDADAHHEGPAQDIRPVDPAS